MNFTRILVNLNDANRITFPFIFARFVRQLCEKKNEKACLCLIKSENNVRKIYKWSRSQIQISLFLFLSLSLTFINVIDTIIRVKYKILMQSEQINELWLN